MLFEIENIKSALSSHSPVRHPIGQNTRRAAVAAILKPEIDHTQAVVIIRASKEGEPRGGQKAFPGGHIKRQTSHPLPRRFVKPKKRSVLIFERMALT